MKIDKAIGYIWTFFNLFIGTPSIADQPTNNLPIITANRPSLESFVQTPNRIKDITTLPTEYPTKEEDPYNRDLVAILPEMYIRERKDLMLYKGENPDNNPNHNSRYTHPTRLDTSRPQSHRVNEEVRRTFYRPRGEKRGYFYLINS